MGIKWKNETKYDIEKYYFGKPNWNSKHKRPAFELIFQWQNIFHPSMRTKMEWTHG